MTALCLALCAAVCAPTGLGGSPPSGGIQRELGPLLGTLRRTKRGPRRNPAERFRWGEAELRSERVFAPLGGNEGYEASDNDKQDKGRGRRRPLREPLLPAVRAVTETFPVP